MPDSDGPTPKTISGTAMVLGLFALALAMALFAWFYARAGDRRALEAWGPQRAALIDAAPTAELWVLSPGETNPTEADAADTLNVDGQSLHIIERHDITSARGVLHIRRGLIDDTSFAWDAGSDENCAPEWTHTFSFADGDRRVSLLLSLDCPRVRLVETGRELSIGPIVAVVREFVAEQVGTEPMGAEQQGN